MLVNILVLGCAGDDSNHLFIFQLLSCLVQLVIRRLLDKVCLSSVTPFIVLELDPVSLLTKPCLANRYRFVHHKLLVYTEMVPVAVTFEDSSPVIESVCKIRILSYLCLLVSLHDFRHPLVEFSENRHAFMKTDLLLRLKFDHYHSESLMILRLTSSFYLFRFGAFF